MFPVDNNLPTTFTLFTIMNPISPSPRYLTHQVCDDAAAVSGLPISIANYLVDGNYAVSGAKGACDKARELAVAAGARMALPLAVAGAFHTGATQLLTHICYFIVFQLLLLLLLFYISH